MDFSELNKASTFSIAVACIIGIIRFTKVLPAYRPFLVFVWMATVNEIASLVFIHLTNNNLLNSNIYVLVEYQLLLLVFFTWNRQQAKKRFGVLAIVGLLVWVLDNLVVHSLYTVNAAYRVVYSMIILFLSINQINKLLLFEKKNVGGNAMFQICMGFGLYFSFRAFIEAFYLLEMPFSKGFYLNLFIILLIINLLANLVYAIAIICMPTKREFILPS